MKQKRGIDSIPVLLFKLVIGLILIPVALLILLIVWVALFIRRNIDLILLAIAFLLLVRALTGVL